jgi:hypothetical protein
MLNAKARQTEPNSLCKNLNLDQLASHAIIVSLPLFVPRTVWSIELVEMTTEMTTTEMTATEFVAIIVAITVAAMRFIAIRPS